MNANITSENERIKSIINQALQKIFRPEFLNRLDEIIIFIPTKVSLSNGDAFVSQILVAHTYL